LVVDALHRIGNQNKTPLVKVNCAALSETLLESELFGHVRGAFTGAISNKTGRFERANGGTIFLDEIGDISLRMQSRLLRVIETGEFDRVGDSKTIKVVIRVVTATNQNLKKKVASGDFRQDLFYRLKVVEINLPPLRERREDIPLLIEHFLERFNHSFSRKIKGVSAEAFSVLMLHSWPGNIRELGNSLEHAYVRCRQKIITTEHLPPEFLTSASKINTSAPTDRKLREAQKIKWALGETAWNKTQAAHLLGVSRRTIYRKIDEYRITPEA
jgi:transcriptional regulator with PAS, ATPase and Fis domain